MTATEGAGAGVHAAMAMETAEAGMSRPQVSRQRQLLA